MDFLNFSADDFINSQTQKVRVSDENIYDPDIKTAPNGVYKAVLRFVPWHGAKSVDDLRYKKYSIRLVNPTTGDRLWIDDPSTIKLSSVFWNIETALKNLEKEEPKLVEEIKKSFSRSYKYFSLVYIKKDPQNPALEGKIKVLPYGHTIWSLGQALIDPQDADLGTTQKVNIFSLLDGRDFIFVAKKKTEKWRDFSSSKFMDQASPLIIKTATGKEVAFSNDPQAKEAFSTFLKKNSPDLGSYFFKEWVETDYSRVVAFLKAAIPYKPLLDNAFNQCRDEKIKAAYAASFNQTASNLSTIAPAPKATLDLLDSEVDFSSASTLSTKHTSSAAVANDDDDMFKDL